MSAQRRSYATEVKQSQGLTMRICAFAQYGHDLNAAQESDALPPPTSADPFGGRDLFHGRFAQALHRTEFPQEQIFPVLAHARTIIENAFADPLLHQQLVIGVGEAMRFIADALKQTQRAGIRRQLQRQRAARPINFFEFFGQADDRQLVQAQAAAVRGRRKRAGPCRHRR